ncbi:hypothetical protein [Sorangium sp. So ce176]|uniref:hypothetical protein n=1 Tax=Sorangium sp. So ce176 TaxID=3133286 RepID=UPI003F64461B
MGGGPIELYPLSSSVADRASKACQLDVDAVKQVALFDLATARAADLKAGNHNCEALLTSRDSWERAVSVPGSTAHALVRFQAPAAYAASPTTSVEIEAVAEGGQALKPDWTLPSDIGQAAPPQCFVHAGHWSSVPCKGGKVTPPPALQKMIEASVARGEMPVLVVQAIDATSGPAGAWRRVPVRLKQKQFDLEKHCAGWVQEERKQKLVTQHEFYAICVNFRELSSPYVMTLAFEEGSGEEGSGEKCSGETCEVVGHVLHVRRPIVVYVWHSDHDAEIQLDGDQGMAPWTYVPAGHPVGDALGAALVAPAPEKPDAPVPPRSRLAFAPRSGKDATLTVTLKSGDKQVKSVKHFYVVENLYRGALRVALGLGWSPWARQVDIVTAADGRKYVDVTAGEGAISGLTSAELFLGYSHFFCDMPQLSAKVCGGLGAWLGVLGASSEGINPFTSLVVGPELAIGRDFSIGLAAGVHRHDAPKESFRPGRVAPDGATKVDTTFGLTPHVGLMINFVPAFFRAAGLPLAGGT